MRRKLLLDAAIQLLETTPIEELSFKQVSEKAGVPEGSAYHFFANRYDLLKVSTWPLRWATKKPLCSRITGISR